MVRFKSRYLLCEISFASPNGWQHVDEKKLHRAILEAIQKVHGDFGVACCAVSFAVKYLNTYTGILLLRCRKAHYRLLWSTLAFIHQLGKKETCVITCIHVGGTIRTCQKFLIGYNKQQLLRKLPACKSEAERTALQEAVRSCSLKELQEDVVSASEEDSN
ncbi:ribonuclease P/MRP protein subunit POP5 [Polypterus senegalus]|uniref:ribonuclease P/MRP protein subunit POP5 n=1 Tax=Polypterus senegalus TaxID=55291 RepID=UPI001965EE92|nr:ribonuclease P/MRP protein subunit POP5 [Polypterus senegalus]